MHENTATADARMTRPRLVLVDHDYHRTTGSSAFFSELLGPHFDIVPLVAAGRDGAGASVTAESINAHAPDFVVFYQLRPRRRHLARLRCSNVTWVPMYDDINVSSSAVRRLRFSGLKVVHFSKATRLFFGEDGFSNLSVQYFPEPEESRRRGDDTSLRIFFWLRRSEPGWPCLKALLGDRRPDRVVLRVAPDPGETPALPCATDVDKYRVEVHQGWLPAGEYRRRLLECNVFMAPRLKEGIGIATLEAMSHGLAVIAPDHPTMNEYVEHGVSGFLFDPANPQPLELENLAAVGTRAREAVRDGHAQWLASKSQIPSFVLRPGSRQSLTWRLRRLLRV